MFGLAKRTNSVTVAVEKPKPQLVRPGEQRLSEYEALAAELNFYPGQLLQAQIYDFLINLGIPVFNIDEVNHYMRAEAVKQGKIFRWRPLRERDASNAGWQAIHGEWWGHGGFSPSSDRAYDKAVPIHILRQVKQIQDKFGDAVQFFVTDYAVPNPDPFIAVTGKDVPLIVFGVWDEPGFFSHNET